MEHDHPLLRRLGETVRTLRKSRDWSRRELAERTGISERFLADVENGAANPSLLRLVELAQALEVELPALLSGFGGRAARRHAALLGLRGAGKSTVGPLVAKALQRPFVELDAKIEAATGLQLGELFQLHGEAYYRSAERRTLEQVLAGEPAVLAVGGGLVTEPTTFALLRGGAVTVWLRAEPEQHWQRVLAQGDRRPMADGDDRAFADLRRILAAREPLYAQADLTVDTSNRSVAQTVDAVLAGLAASAP